MRKMTVAVLAALFATEIVEAEGNAAMNLTKEERNRLRLEKTGGMVARAGNGKAVFVNCQSKFSLDLISASIDPFKELLKVEMEARNGTWKFGDKLPVDANVAVYIVDDAALPMSLIAPEARWGVMNVAQIDKEANFKKEATRVAILTLGAGCSQYKISPMQPVVSPSDLNQIMGYALTVDVTMSMKTNLEKLGLTPTRYTTYRAACKAGWAPAPTNEVQKAIWNEVHAVPKTPMKIEFDPKTGR